MPKDNKDKKEEQTPAAEPAKEQAPVEEEITGAFAPEVDAPAPEPEEKPQEEPDCPICGKTRHGKVKVIDLDFVNMLIHVEGCPVCKTCLFHAVQPKFYKRQ